MNPLTSASLELEGITKRFGDLVAVRDLSLKLQPGEVFGFVGSNGAGKTTTMRIVLGVLLPDQGEVLWAGSPIEFETRRRIGYMPEERGLYPKMRIGEQLTYLAQLHGADGSTDSVSGTVRAMSCRSSAMATSSESSSRPPWCSIRSC
jgi:ABC-2 type transport system ATP-binding protein